MLTYILLVLAIYAYLFNPVFSILPGVDTLMLLYPIVFLLLRDDYRKDFRQYKSILLLWFLLLIFILLKTIDGGDQTYLYVWIGYLIETILITFCLSKIIVDKGMDFVRLLLITSSIAATISSLCLFIPAFDSIIRTIQIEYTEISAVKTFRGFGLAQGLNFEYGVVQGVIFGVGLFNIKDNKWFAFFMPIVILSILINARTGFIIVLLSIILFVIQRKKFVIPIVATIIILFFLPPLLEKYIPEETYLWVEEFFLELEDSLTGSNKAQFNTSETLKEMLIFPKDLASWLVGTGYSLFRVKSGAHSDVGYVNQLAYGGLLYVIPLYLMSFLFIKKSRKTIPILLFAFILITPFLANFKSGVFGTNGGIFKSIALFSFCCYQKMKNDIMFKVKKT